MDKFQIAEILRATAHAGSKAPSDVRKIAQDIGFVPCDIKPNDLKTGFVHKLNRQREFAVAWSRVYKKITENSIVVLQQPLYPNVRSGGGAAEFKKKKTSSIHFSGA